MPHSNDTLVRGAFDAFRRGDLEWFQTNAFDPQIAYHIPGDNAIAGTYEGIEAVLGIFGRIAQETNGTFNIEAGDVIANDELVAVAYRATGKRGGKELSLSEYMLLVMKDGKAVNAWIHPSDQQQFNEFWS